MSLIFTNTGEKEALKRWAFGWGALVTNATNATPIVLTIGNHPFQVNDHVFVSDVGGTTNANGAQVVSAIAATTITLSGAVGNGAYTSGGSVSLATCENLTLKLYSNNVTPSQTDVAGTYTEATFTGYVAKTLNSKYSIVSAWGTPTSGNPANIAYPQQSWSPTSSQTIFGYFIVGAQTTTLHLAELFASSKNLVSGDALQLTPSVNGQ